MNWLRIKIESDDVPIFRGKVQENEFDDLMSTIRRKLF